MLAKDVRVSKLKSFADIITAKDLLKKNGANYQDGNLTSEAVEVLYELDEKYKRILDRPAKRKGMR